jgi:hypothetical protein
LPYFAKSAAKIHIYKSLETFAKRGIPGQNKEKQNYDKNTRNACGDSFHLPRQCLMDAVKA